MISGQAALSRHENHGEPNPFEKTTPNSILGFGLNGSTRPSKGWTNLSGDAQAFRPDPKFAQNFACSVTSNPARNF
jgi:hypothetical protein